MLLRSQIRISRSQSPKDNKPISTANTLESNIAFPAASLFTSPVAPLLYSSTKGSMTLNQDRGNRAIETMREYPWGS